MQAWESIANTGDFAALRFGAARCKSGEWILSPPRMPFRHPGFSAANLYYQKSYHNIDAMGVLCLNLQFHINRRAFRCFSESGNRIKA